jgi:hypothetical protein
MLLAKRPQKIDLWQIACASTPLISGWFLLDAKTSDFTAGQIRQFKIREITDAALLSDLLWLTHDVWDGAVRRMTTGEQPLSEPLSGADLAAHLRGIKWLAKIIAADHHSAAWERSLQAESALEQQSWTQQLSEAEAVLANPTAEAPLLSVLAAARNVSVPDYAATVVAAAAATAADQALRLAALKSTYQAIDGCETAAEVKNLGWL